MDNLENFFRDRAQRHNLEFDEGDWRKLERQLDNELPVAFSFWKFLMRYWYLLALLLILPIFWFVISTNGKTNQAIVKTNTIKKHADKTENTDLLESAEDNMDQKGIVNTENTNSTESLSSAKGEQNFSAAISDRKIQSHGNANLQLSTTVFSKEVNDNLNKKSYAVFENGTELEGHILISELHFLSPISPKFDDLSAEWPTEINPVTLEIIDTKTKSKPNFSIGIGYSPDFSTVGIGNFVAPGSRWSFLLEYSFLNRFSINTGVVLVNNKYEANGEDYHAPSRYWKKGQIASEAYGECKMVDIPLNVRFDALSNGRHKLFISAGASTYLVLKEDYIFEYEQEDPELPHLWGTDKMSKYPFAIINASFGYEYLIGRKSALQIEPFIKIPTTGIGWGDVNLHTFGIYFMYKYKIGK